MSEGWVHSDPNAEPDDSWQWEVDPRWCAGPCMDGARRRVKEYNEDLRWWRGAMAEWKTKRRGRPPMQPEWPRFAEWLGSPVFDGMCAAAIRQSLIEIDDQAALYAAAADGHRGAGDEPHVSGPTTAARSPSPTVEDLDELDGWLRSWRATQMGTDTWARAGMLAQSITTQVTWIMARLDVMLSRKFAADFGREVLAWHRRLGRASKSDVVVKRLPLRCPGCRRLSLEQRQGDAVVTCRFRDCPTMLRLDEYDALVERAAGVAKQEGLMPAPLAVGHRILVPGLDDDRESRAAGARGVSEGIRIDQDTYRLVFDAPFRRPLLEEEWATLPWPACPSCRKAIVVHGSVVVEPAKPAAMVGSSVLPELPAERHVVPRWWGCSQCGAGG